MVLIIVIYIYISSAVTQFKGKIGETVNITWEASTFLASGYNIYHKNIRNTINQKRSNIGKEQLTDDRNLSIPYYSNIVMLEIRNVSPDDAGYYNSGWSTNAAMLGGGAILIVLGMIF